MGYILLIKLGYNSFFSSLRARLLDYLWPSLCTLVLLGVFDLSSGDIFVFFFVKVLEYWLFSILIIY